ncbi:MAG: choice-of-anchor D domain-containing protein [Acidobacteria bacterium]|nr:choice-of-anchor D domain-containing protein [Acidobacteriota bacterium]
MRSGWWSFLLFAAVAPPGLAQSAAPGGTYYGQFKDYGFYVNLIGKTIWFPDRGAPVPVDFVISNDVRVRGTVTVNAPDPPPIASRSSAGDHWVLRSPIDARAAFDGNVQVPSYGTGFKVTVQARVNTVPSVEAACPAAPFEKPDAAPGSSVRIQIAPGCRRNTLQSSGTYLSLFEVTVSDIRPGGLIYYATFSVSANYTYDWPQYTLDRSDVALQDADSRSRVLSYRGQGPLEWRATAKTNDGAPWLSVNPSSGTMSKPGESVTLTISSEPSALGSLPYYPTVRWGTVTVSSPFQPADPFSIIAVTLTITKPPSDRIRATLTTPSAGATLFVGPGAEIEVTADYALVSRESGAVLLRVEDQKGNLLITSPAQTVARGAGRASLKTGPFEIPQGTTSLLARAVLMAGNQTLLESDPLGVSVGESPDSIGFVAGSLKPALDDPRQGLAPESQQNIEARVRYTLASANEGRLSLRLMQGEVLAAASEFVDVKRSDGANVEKLLEIKNAKIPKEGPLYLMAVLIHRVTERVLAKAVSANYALAPDLSVGDIEVVQAVQRPGNDLALVPGKSTVVRVFVKQTGWLEQQFLGVKGTLRCFRVGEDTEIPGAPLLLNLQGVTAHENPDRNNQDHSLNFLIPKEWTQQGWRRFEAELKPPPDRSEGPLENNKASIDNALFTDAILTDRYHVAYVRVCRPGPVKCPSAAVANHAGFFKKVYPLADGGLQYDEVPGGAALIFNSPAVGDAAHTELIARLKEYWQHLLEGGHKDIDQLVGWVATDFGVSRVGYSDPRWKAGKGWVVWAMDDADAYNSLAHEIGHNLGLRHPNTDDAACPQKAEDPSTDWKAPDGQIQDPGFDPLARKLVPRSSYDLMTYCDAAKAWISAFHLRKLFNEMRERTRERRARAASAGRDSRRLAEGSDQILIRGAARRDGSAARLNPVFRTVSTLEPDLSDPEGNHCLRFDGAGGPIGSFCFTLTFLDYDNGRTLDEEAFTFRVAMPPGVTRVALMRGEQELAALEGGGGAPAVSILAPRAGERWEGERTLMWSASDPGGKPLLFSVHYSYDGGQTWAPLALEVDEPQWRLDTAQIRGGAQVHFRVTARNGLEAGQATVGPVTIVENPRIEVTPPALNFGILTQHEVPELELTLKNVGSGILMVNRITVDNPAFLLPGDAPFTLRGGAQRTLILRFPAAATGTQRGTVAIETNDAIRPSVTVPVTAGVFDSPVAILEVTPAALGFGAVPVGQSKDLAVTLSNSGSANLDVRTLTLNNPQFRVVAPAVPLTIGPGSKQAVTLRFTPASAGAQSAALTIASNDPSRPSVTVALTGTGEAAAPPAGTARIAVTPDRLDFGTVTVGQTKDLPLSISAAGATAPLVVSGISSSDPRFTLVSPAIPFTLNAGAAATATIRFAPAGAGALAATLTIRSNAVNQPALAVPLAGTGAAMSAGPRDVVLQADDGTFERTAGYPGWSGDAYWVNRLTPEPHQYPATLKKIQIYFPADGDIEPRMGIGLLVGTLPAGTEDLTNVRLQVVAAQVPRTGAWVDFSVAEQTIEAGDFVVGFNASVASGVKPVALDISRPAGRSYASKDGLIYQKSELIGLGGNFGIRAVVTAGK